MNHKQTIHLLSSAWLRINFLYVERNALLLLRGVKEVGFDQIKKGEGGRKVLRKMVSNMPLTHPHPLAVIFPITLTAAVISYTKAQLSRAPCNIIAGNDGAVTATAVIATYSVRSNNDE